MSLLTWIKKEKLRIKMDRYRSWVICLHIRGCSVRIYMYRTWTLTIICCESSILITLKAVFLLMYSAGILQALVSFPYIIHERCNVLFGIGEMLWLTVKQTHWNLQLIAHFNWDYCDLSYKLVLLLSFAKVALFCHRTSFHSVLHDKKALSSGSGGCSE